MEEPAWQRMLAAVVAARRQLDEAEHLAVLMAREAGRTWEQIGEGLGMTRQAARRRFERVRRRRD